MHLVLVGDSIIDNAAYIAEGEPDVLHQVRERLGARGGATRLAVDGSVAADVKRQLGGLPSHATHLFVSVGGNDALQCMGMLTETAESTAEVLERFATIRDRFQTSYREMLESVLGPGLPTVLCTIYDPRFPDPRIQRSAVIGLAIFNDVITRLAGDAGVPLIDLRRLFDDARYYANPIEPSVAGGARLADVICRVATEHDFSTPRSTLYPDVHRPRSASASAARTPRLTRN
jgi:lysophospholipase L1-like esterase